jgi:hypothetical protein
MDSNDSVFEQLAHGAWAFEFPRFIRSGCQGRKQRAGLIDRAITVGHAGRQLHSPGDDNYIAPSVTG